jgi:hypothetical protein
MILAYNGKKKNMQYRLAMNKLYAKDFTIVSGEGLEDEDFYDSLDEGAEEMDLFDGDEE